MDPEVFKEFKHTAVHALSDLNEECDSKYHVSSFPHWEYDLDRGTLTFSEGGVPKVVASIQVVGTTHTPSRTWMWGWANETLPEQVMHLMSKVRKFGESEHLHQLTESSLPDDEHLGWAMTAIAAQILSAKGAYRCPGDNGFLYCIYNDIWFSGKHETTESNHGNGENRITCSTHGEGIATFICEHLCFDPGQKWFSSAPDKSNPWPDAWCANCDKIFQEQGEWNEHNEGRMKPKLLCPLCYESARSLATLE